MASSIGRLTETTLLKKGQKITKESGQLKKQQVQEHASTIYDIQDLGKGCILLQLLIDNHKYLNG